MDVPVKHFLMTRLNLTRSYGPGPVLIAVFRLAILLILVSAGTFTLLSFSPVDPIRAYIGNDLLHVPAQQYPLIAARWGLDQPLWLRFWHWFSQVIQGDLGYSMIYNAPVAQVIGERFALSFILLASAWLLSGLLGIMLGLTAGRYLHRWPDRLICRIATCCPHYRRFGWAYYCWRYLPFTGNGFRFAVPGHRVRTPTMPAWGAPSPCHLADGCVKPDRHWTNCTAHSGKSGRNDAQ